MRITSKGQVTIPKHIRDQLGIKPGDEVRFESDGQTVVVEKAAAHSKALARENKLSQWAESVSGSMTGFESTDAFMGTVRDRDVPLS